MRNLEDRERNRYQQRERERERETVDAYKVKAS